MNFRWTDTLISEAEVCEIEHNIKEELGMLVEIDEDELDHWIVNLSENSFNRKLIGVAIDQDEVIKVNFTYSLENNRFTEYKLL